MGIDNLIVLAILLGSLILFVTEKLRVDVVALLVLAALILTGLVTVEEAFSGFASPAVITVWSVFIISGGLYRSGIADALARVVLRFAGEDPLRLLIVIMFTVGVMSAFMNNIGAVAIMLPAVVSLCNRLQIPPSKMLMPLAFAALMGGNMTLIGTPPNILAADILDNYEGLESFSFFDFLPMGLIVLLMGILYMVLIGRHLLPARRSPSAPGQAVRLRPYLAELRIPPDSSLVGKSILDAALGARYELNIIHISRGHEPPFAPTAEDVLQIDDVLLIEGEPEKLLTATAAFDLDPTPGSHIEQLVDELTPGDSQLAEITLAPSSTLIGKTLEQIGFRARYGISVLAVRSGGASTLSPMAEMRLNFGDALLVQGPVKNMSRMREDENVMFLDRPPLLARRLSKGPLALGILAVVLVVISLGWLHPSSAMFLGALGMVVTGVLRMDEAYQAIEWQAVFLIAGILPLGLAMESTGTAALIADWITSLIGDAGPRMVLLGMFVMTAMLTEVISNAAATVLVVPIAIDTAFGIGANPHAFVMAVVIAASTSFLMPIGHQVNVLIFGPGGYRFSDYTKVGIGLNLLMLLVVIFFLPIFWPLMP